VYLVSCISFPTEGTKQSLNPMMFMKAGSFDRKHPQQ